MSDAPNRDLPGHQGRGSQPIEMIETHDRTIGCDGGIGALGHPRVFLRILDRSIDCPYCGRRYVLAATAPDNAH